MSISSRRFLVIGAHPDDPDLRFGGSAIKLTQAGHQVKFVSMTNGNCGHLTQGGAALAARRYEESQNAARLFGVQQYQILDVNDCELEPSLDMRKQVIGIIRDFQPDVVLTHRSCDYHADHRACAQLVQDSAYLVMVPQFCPESPIPAQNPVFAYVYDAFVEPRPLRVDAAVDIDSVLNAKNRALDCHVSQFYEWLAYEKGYANTDFSQYSWEQKSDYLTEHWGARFKNAADLARKQLQHCLGQKAGAKVKYAEVFEQSAYGSILPQEEFQQLFLE
jgi:LmbE family N-acetylglucosaminyl deacetylase